MTFQTNRIMTESFITHEMRDAAYETAFALIDAELALGELFQDDEIDEDMERYLWGFTPE